MKWILLPCLALGLSAVCAAQSFDSPNYEYERRLHEIYSKYNSKAVPSADWSKLVEGLDTETYSIQKGDNLWNVSKVLFGDGNYWPKVWSQNSGITNPHLINPGNKITFFVGNADQAPGFSISESGDAGSGDDNFSMNDSDSGSSTVVNHSSATSDNAVGAAAGVVIPPPKNPPTPVLNPLPPSLPRWKEVTEEGPGFDEWGLEIIPPKILKIRDEVTLPLYVADQPPQVIGEYYQSESETPLVMAGESVYLKLKNGQAQVGDTVLLIRDHGPLRQSQMAIGDQAKIHGDLVEILAEVHLDAPISVSSEVSGYTFYKANVIRALGLGVQGASVIQGRMARADLSPKGPNPGINVHIIGGDLDNRGTIFGAGSWVFLDKGAKDGLAAGQVLQVSTNSHLRRPNSPIVVGDPSAALVKVVKTDATVATGLILKSRESLRQGDFTTAVAASSSLPLPQGTPQYFDDGQKIHQNDNLEDELDDTGSSDQTLSAPSDSSDQKSDSKSYEDLNDFN